MEPKELLISAIILARNEEERIAECLRSVAWADEMIVVDNHSSDDTSQVAKKEGARVVESAAKDFSKLRNIGKDAAKGMWLLYVDADERVTSALKEEILTIVRNYSAGDPVCYFISRQNYYLGQPWPERDRMQRLFLKNALRDWTGKLHETAQIDGVSSELQNSLRHFTHRTLEQMIAKTNEWSEAEARLRYDSGHPPVVAWRLLRVFFTGFIDWFFTKGGWKSGTVGVIEGLYQGFSLFITYAKLWELQHVKKH